MAWYALVHLAGSELAEAVGALTRVLAPGGWLALALHVGDEVWHLDELCGEPVDLDFVLHDQAEVLAAVDRGRAGRRRVVPARAGRRHRGPDRTALRPGPPGAGQLTPEYLG